MPGIILLKKEASLFIHTSNDIRINRDVFWRYGHKPGFIGDCDANGRFVKIDATLEKMHIVYYQYVWAQPSVPSLYGSIILDRTDRSIGENNGEGRHT